MSWIAIVAALSSALISAYLVMFRGWEAWQAILLVSGIALGFVLSVIAIVFVFSDAAGRNGFKSAFRKAFEEDCGGMLRWIRGK